MENLRKKLENVPDSYDGFVLAMLNYANYASYRRKKLEAFINANPTANSSDIIKYLASDPEFFDDCVSDSYIGAQNIAV